MTDYHYSPTFKVHAVKTEEDYDGKPWAAIPGGPSAPYDTWEDTVKIAWGRTADEAIAQWGALYYFEAEPKHEHAGRNDMTNWEALK